mgnify:CR=1 FL=1
MSRPVVRRAATLLVALAGLAGAAAPLAAQPRVAPTHAYSLNGSLAESAGGPALESMGGSVGSTGYAFAPGQGLRLSGLTGGVYSIEMVFALERVTGYRKVLDFDDRQSDDGFYVQNGWATFYRNGAVSSDAALFAGGTSAHLVLTRDADKRITAYVDGVQALSFVDTYDTGAFGTGGFLHLLVDDRSTGYEQAAGFLDWARVYDRALTGEQVRDRFARGDDPLGGDTPPPVTTTPEPATVALMGAGLLALCLAARRRRPAAA